MRPHVGTETLARYRQGELSPRKSARIGAHLTRCDRCSELNAALAGVSTLLANVAPPSMPGHLTARIQTALATESARRVAAPEDGRRSRHERLIPDRRPHRPRLSHRAALGTLAAAAVVVVVAAGGYELFGHGAGAPSSSAAPSAPLNSPATGPLGRPVSGSAGLRAPVAVGPALPYRYAGQQHTVTAIASGTDYTSEQLGRQVSAEGTRYGAAGVHATPMTPSAATGPNAGSSALGKIPASMLAGCVNRIAAGERVLLVDVAHYQGAAATVIVTEGSASAPEQVWVVGTGCSGTRSDVLQHTTLTPSG
jgi:hypothetical protein